MQKIDLERLRDSFNLSHELTRSGIEKLVADFEGTVGEGRHIFGGFCVLDGFLCGFSVGGFARLDRKR
jgi:hypothetical protein